VATGLFAGCNAAVAPLRAPRRPFGTGLHSVAPQPGLRSRRCAPGSIPAHLLFILIRHLSYQKSLDRHLQARQILRLLLGRFSDPMSRVLCTSRISNICDVAGLFFTLVGVLR